MTIQSSLQWIICDYCDNCDCCFGNKKDVWEKAKSMGWLTFKRMHFDTKECLEAYKKQRTVKNGIH